MDSSSAPFKSPRPPAPRKARGASLSRQSSRQSLRDAFGSNQDDVPLPPPPPLPASSAFGLGMDLGHSSNAMLDEDVTSIKNHNNTFINGKNSSRSDVITQLGNESNSKTSTNTTAAVLAKLEGLLVAKSNEIQLAGRLGEALLSQQAELESRIRELEDEVKKNDEHTQVFGNGKRSQQYKTTRQRDMHVVDDDDLETIHNNNNDDDSDIESAALLDEKVKEKLRELEMEMMKWEKGNEEIYKEVGVASGTGSELVRQASSTSMVSSREALHN